LISKAAFAIEKAAFAHSESGGVELKSVKRAFTLIELLVVIAIIAILAAILFPVFARAKAAAKNIVCVSNARQVGMADMMYLQDNDDTSPIFYAYNSQPPAGQPGHKGVEVLLLPYCHSKDVFHSPLDDGGPYTSIDVPGATSYWQAYGSSYRFTHCLFSTVAGESTENNVPYTTTDIVNQGSIEYPAESRIMRLEMMPWFSHLIDIGCATYGYDCPAPNDYYREWSPTGGTLIYADGHAKFIVKRGDFDQSRVDPAGDRSSDPNSTYGTWYWVCD
jgi:prepilin-type N-terminal cleavage/methylation domain-containing protein